MRADRNARRGPARTVLTALALVTAWCTLAGCTAASAPAQPSLLSGSIGGNALTYLKPVKTRALGTVVGNGTGYTLYWFSTDTTTYSTCEDTCIPQWPPVTGTPEIDPGTTLPGKLGTIYRPGGGKQATYDGHPLYTYAGDFDPGDVGGDGVVQFGGTWHAVRPG
jgi:predicted lipoprotein with Yx(FWY)xxD motif